jgi:hypothetical protein
LNRKSYLFLFVVGLLVAGAISSLQSSPGYMDADYYYAGGMQLASGKGFNEPYIWNYLDNPASLPHPSNTYWMPLSSLIAAVGMVLGGNLTFGYARLGFILIAALVPLVTAALAYQISPKRETAVLSGLLAVFSVYHAPFMATTDNFAPFMLLGGLFFLALIKPRRWTGLWLGMLAGLMNLARSDGLLWLPLAGIASMYLSWTGPGEISERSRIKRLISLIRGGLLSLLGFLLVMGPWFYRNLTIFGTILAPGGNHLLWLTIYDQTFIYPASSLTLQAWLQAGLDAALRVRVWALRQNLLNAFAAQGSIALFPFILLGLWHMRREFSAKLAAFGWLLLLVTDTLLFPFAGARGGFFHAGTAFQPFWWAVAPLGLDAVVSWARQRGWFTPQAHRIFRVSLVALLVALTVLIVQMRVVSQGWGVEDQRYVQVEAFLQAQGAAPDEIVMVRNPPGYFMYSQRPAIVTPYGTADVFLAAAHRYGAKYLLLEREGALPPIKPLYENPQSDSAFTYLGTINSVRIFRIQPVINEP